MDEHSLILLSLWKGDRVWEGKRKHSQAAAQQLSACVALSTAVVLKPHPLSLLLSCSCSPCLPLPPALVAAQSSHCRLS